MLKQFFNMRSHIWQQHFGRVWGNLVSAKRRYNPDNLLTPSQGIFANC
ncbi:MULTISPECIES: hypothetical protein [unclassified Nostoc]|nr:hypothetical protein [Nostoc sp. DedQUE03]MDZ7977202.1 hypothetical protein [Nostoc sp. DedQUE03]MDZ8042730.1 hypothetical protein [Nostoc sp. DedQUE02]